MTTTERPEKRLLLLCEHPSTELCECRLASLAAVLARYPAGKDASGYTTPAVKPGRELVVLAEIRTPRTRVTPQPPPVITDDDDRHGDSLLGAAGAWACVALVVLLMLTLTARQLWLWWF